MLVPTMTDHHYINTAIVVNEQAYVFKKLISDKYSAKMGARRAVFEGVKVSSQRPVILICRFCFIHHPLCPDEQYIDMKLRARTHFRREVKALTNCAMIEQTPLILGSEELVQDHRGPCECGDLLVIVTSKVYGTSLNNIYDLTSYELHSIKELLVRLLERIRQVGVLYNGPDKSHIRLDRDTEQIYLIGFSDCSFGDPRHTQKVTANSWEVALFGLWD